MSGSWMDYLRMMGQAAGALNGAGGFGGMPAPPDTSGLTLPPGGLAIQPGVGMPPPPSSPSGGLGQPGVVPSGTPFPVQDSSGLTVDGAMARPYPYATVAPNAGLPRTPGAVPRGPGPMSVGPPPVPPGYVSPPVQPGYTLPPVPPGGGYGDPDRKVYFPPGAGSPGAPPAPVVPGSATPDPNKPPPNWFDRNIGDPISRIWNGTPKMGADGKPIIGPDGKPVMEEAAQLTARQKALVGGASSIGAGLAARASTPAAAPAISGGGAAAAYKPAAFDASRIAAGRAAEIAAYQQKARLAAPWLRRYQQAGLMGGGG